MCSKCQLPLAYHYRLFVYYFVLFLCVCIFLIDLFFCLLLLFGLLYTFSQGESKRPFVMTPGGEGSTDYVNATFLDVSL